MDLAGAEGDAVAAGGDDEQVAPVVDPVGDACAPVPGDLAPAQGVALAPGGEDRVGVGLDPAPRCRLTTAASRWSACPQQRRSVGSPAGREARRGRRVAQLGGELVGGDREVQADADHRPAVLGPGLDQDAGELAVARPRRRWAT